MKKAVIFLIFVVSGLSMISGCQKKEPVHTVDWCKVNKAERANTLAKCKNDPGTLSLTPNCINANRAEQELTWSSRKGIEVKPLTVDDFKKKN